jgi:hypothetical protein
MAKKLAKKRPSKGQRTHTRRLKQEARKDVIVTTPAKVQRAPTKPAVE